MNFNENEKITDIAFREPLGIQTRKYRTILMLISIVTTLISIKGLSLNTILWIQVDNFNNTQPIVLGAFVVAINYYLLGFLIYAWHDLKQWSMAKDFARIHTAFAYISTVSVKYHAINRYIEKIDTNEYKKNEALEELLRMSKLATGLYTDQLEDEVFKLKKTLTDYQYLHKGQVIKLIVLDFGIPISLACLALFKNHEHLIPFIKILFTFN